MYLKVTSSPTVGWVWQQLLNATPWGRQPRHLIHDRDNVLQQEFRLQAGRPRCSRHPDPVQGAEGECDRREIGVVQAFPAESAHLLGRILDLRQGAKTASGL